MRLGFWAPFSVLLIGCGGGDSSSGGTNPDGGGGSGGSGGGGIGSIDGVWLGSTKVGGSDVGVLLDLELASGSLIGHAWLRVSGATCQGDLADVVPSVTGFTARLPGSTAGNVTCDSVQLKGTLTGADMMVFSGTSIDANVSATLERLERLTPTPLVGVDVRKGASAKTEIREARYVEPGLAAVAVEGPATLELGDQIWNVPASGFVFADVNTFQAVQTYEVTLSSGQLASPTRPSVGGLGQALVSIGGSNGATGDYKIASGSGSQTVTSTDAYSHLTALVGSNGSITWAGISKSDQIAWRPQQGDWIELDASANELHWIDSTGSTVSTKPLPDYGNSLMTIAPDGAIAVLAQNSDKLLLSRFDPAGTVLGAAEIAIGVSSVVGAVTLADGAIVASGIYRDDIIGRMLLFRVETNDSVGWQLVTDGTYDIDLSPAQDEVLVRGQTMLPFTRIGNRVLEIETSRFVARLAGSDGTLQGICVLGPDEDAFGASLLPDGKILITTGASIGTYQPCETPQ